MTNTGGTLWGGRFDAAPDDALWRFTVDTSDRRLLAVDVAGSQAHASMLADVGLLTTREHAAIAEGLATIASEAAADAFEFLPSDEDVHTAVERRLGELAGPVAGKLHTGRSRNDQVAVDLRLYLRAQAAARVAQLRTFVGVLADTAAGHAETVISSFTHLQPAQAVSLGHHLLAHAWALVRDIERFGDLGGRLDVSPLGAGASAGSSLPLDPAVVAKTLGFSRPFDNSLDAVSSRDLAAEYVFVCAQAMVHLSRLAEELIIWSTPQFDWVAFDDAHTTGSSALPQKKNPDIAELVRGKTAAVIGDVTGLLALQKGLPLSYNRDLQEDKRAVFHADETLALALDAIVGMVATASWHPDTPSSWVTALDLAEALVGRGVPFREAHHAVGRLVADLVAAGGALGDATAEDLAATHEAFEPADLARTDPRVSLDQRATPGSGSPASVAAQLESLRSQLDLPEAK